MSMAFATLEDRTDGTILVGLRDGGADPTVIGSIDRGPGLWRDASMRIAVGRDRIASLGMPAIMEGLRSVTDQPPQVAIELHAGYVAVYGADGAPAARVLTTPEGYACRRFDPHSSRMHATMDDALEDAYGAL